MKNIISRASMLGAVAFSLVLGLVGPTSAMAFTSPSEVNLGTAGNYVILAESLISTTGVTAITGDLGLSPFAATFVQGFSLVLDATGCFSTSVFVTGKVYAADYNTLGCTTPAVLGTAVGDMMTAYTDALSRAADQVNLGSAGEIGGLVVAPGVYAFNGGSNNVVISTDVTLTGGANDVWIFQIPGTLSVSANVILAGGAQAKNVFWTVAGATTVFPGFAMNGNILDATNIAFQTGATLTGRALAQTAVTLDANAVTFPPTAPPVVIAPVTPPILVNSNSMPSGTSGARRASNMAANNIGSGQVLGAFYGPGVDAQIAVIKTQLISLIRQLIVILQGDLATAQGSVQDQIMAVQTQLISLITQLIHMLQAQQAAGLSYKG